MWTIVGGVCLGLGVVAVRPPHAPPLVAAGIVLAGAVASVAVLDRRRATRRPAFEPVDWQPRLEELQRRMEAAQAAGRRVVYYWSV